MLIDWFTVIAQTINFLILVWLMKRFLYKPILAAIDAREARIAAKMDEAKAKSAEAARVRDDFVAKNSDFDANRKLLLDNVAKAAEAERQRMLELARHDANALRLRLESAIRREHELLGTDLVDRTMQEVFAIARKLLADLADTSLETQMARIFANRLCLLDATVLANLDKALQTTGEHAILRSAFDLLPESRNLIQQTISKSLGHDIQLDIDIVPSMVCGIELVAGGQKVSWSVTDYLTSLETQVNTLLASTGKNEPSSPHPVNAIALPGQMEPE